MYAPPLSVPEAIRLIAERLARAGHPRTPEDALAEMGNHPFDAPRRMICEAAVAITRVHSVFGAPTPFGVYARAEIELVRAIKVGDITVINDLIRQPDVDRLWPPTVADAIPIPVAASDPAPASQKAAVSRIEKREMTLRALAYRGALSPKDSHKTVAQRVAKELGYSGATVPRGFSEDTISRDRKRLKV